MLGLPCRAAWRKIAFSGRALNPLLAGAGPTEVPEFGVVELTLFGQPERRRPALHCLSFQPELPNIPVHDLPNSIWMQGCAPLRIAQLPEGRELPWTLRGGYAGMILPRLETYAMLETAYEPGPQA